MKRTTSFGFGVRVDMGRQHVAPPPNTYKIPSVFDNINKKGGVFSFGNPASSPKSKPLSNNNAPGPGTYEILKPPGTGASKYTFRMRYPEQSNKEINNLLL